MRASRLLRILLLLQNRGRMTSARLAAELEVAPRTILRDVDALTEAGLPVIVHQGFGGGIELGFDYRTRLTGLDAEEAEAMAVVLGEAPDSLIHLGLSEAAARARSKVWEAFPDQTRAQMAEARDRYLSAPGPATRPDPRRLALARAVRDRRIVRLCATSPASRTVHPSALVMAPGSWSLVDALTGAEIPEGEWGDINISAKTWGPDSDRPAT
jgi:predicted DNA-binding transcriptional regulator YafY